MAFRDDLLRWYKINCRLKMDKENRWWLIWEKNRLMVKRLQALSKSNPIK